METAEDKLIARFFRPLATHPGALALSDDTALFEPPAGHDLVLTTDAVVAGVHVLPEEAPDVMARKALRVNLSDLAAKGAMPRVFLLSLALPRDRGENWLEGFCRGLKEDAEVYGCALIGGDTDRVPGPLTVTIFAIGSLPRGSMVKRSGARAGDRILVSGQIGDAALGLALHRDPLLAERWALTSGERGHLLARYRLPQPRVALAATVRSYASAAIDVSDGFAGDLSKLLRVSGVSGDVALDRVPLSDAVRKALEADPALRETVFGGGEDYEIILTVPSDKVDAAVAAARQAGVVLCDAGQVTEGSGAPRFVDAEGRQVTFLRTGYSHF
jgi:thiamine-monophosphate kinase